MQINTRNIILKSTHNGLQRNRFRLIHPCVRWTDGRMGDRIYTVSQKTAQL